MALTPFHFTAIPRRPPGNPSGATSSEGGSLVQGGVMSSDQVQAEYLMGIMKSLTIGKRLSLGFAGVILITLGVSLYAFTRLEAIQGQATFWLTIAFPVLS